MSARIVRLVGPRRYAEVHALQERLVAERAAGGADVLLLLEHSPTVTLGRKLGAMANVLRPDGVDVVQVERGGDVTWHGPGQLVGYPILHLSQHREDLHWYLRTLEDALIASLEVLGIAADRVPGKTGVWTGDRKIASLGIHVKQWVTLHGFALNVAPDLSWFDAIVPCGLHGVTMTSVARELGSDSPTLADEVRAIVVASLATAFERRARPAALADLVPWG